MQPLKIRVDHSLRSLRSLSSTVTAKGLPLLLVFTFISNQAFAFLPTSPQEIPASPAAPAPSKASASAPEAARITRYDPRRIPAELQDLQELTGLRSSNGAVYEAADGRYLALLSTETLHYRDAEGAWQVSDPSFIRSADSFLVAQNAILSRTGLQEAWLSASVGETAFYWEAHTLSAIQQDRTAVLLSKALPEPQGSGKLEAGNRTLRYAGGWDDPSLEEHFLSSPESLEHILLFNRAPVLKEGAAQYLELQATLELYPGSTLWADGQAVVSALSSAAALEIRAADGSPALRFEPVLAYELAQQDQRVAGNYAVQPGSEPGSYTVSLRTPWSWWTDPQRQYPVVLDPTMQVLKSTGYGDGMAWVRSTGLGDYTLGGIRLGAHLSAWNTETRGYIQFNSLPALLSHPPAPIQVKKATLIVEPVLPAEAMPLYKDSPVDWEHKVIEKKVDLYYVGACPAEVGCSADFSIHDNRLLDTTQYTWSNSPVGTKLETKPLKAGPASGAAQTYPTEFDVTGKIQDWYTTWYTTQTDRPAPTFMLQLVKPSPNIPICPMDGPYIESFKYLSNGSIQFIDTYKQVPNCVWFDLPPGSIQLLVEYDQLPLTIGDNLLNTPGVPSYMEDVFEDTHHQYDLTIQAGLPVWRMVAVRGNHDFVENDPGVPARTGLELWDYSSGIPQSSMVTAAGQGADRTTFIAIDDHHPSTISIADLRVNVTSSSENDYAADLQRNYRIEYIEATAKTLTPSAWTSIPISFPTDRLSKMFEFHLNEGENLLIKSDLPAALEVVLIKPADGVEKQEAVIGADDQRVNRFKYLATTGTDEIGSISKSGVWALVVTNQERPFHDSVRPDYPATLSGTIQILVCAKGSIPTVKFQNQGVNCQPLILPDSSPPPSRVMPIQSGGSLVIHSEGNFIDNPEPGVDWCTTNEGAGAPVIESAASSTYGAYLFVGQGSVCRTGNILTTTPDSGVGLAVPVYNFNPADKRGKYAPGFIYGSTGLYPVPAGIPDGVVQMAANGDFIPLPNTRRNIEPFSPYWEDQFSTTANSERIRIADLRAYGAGMLDAQVLVEAGQAVHHISWDISWVLYTQMDTATPPDPAYGFVPQITQLNPLPQVIPLASLEVRLVDGTVPDGLLPILDSYLPDKGPSAYQLRATGARITTPISLGGATTLGQAVVQPPGLPRKPKNQVSCQEAEISVSCFDLRRSGSGYDWQNGDGEKSVQPWELPDIHIEDQAGSVQISQAGQLNIFSVDHPNAVNAIGQTFSFDTWEATVVVDHAACAPGGPVTTVIRGKGYIALPSLGGDGALAPPWIEMEFTLCETRFQEATLTLEIPAPGIPVGSTGVGVSLIGGTVTVGPDATQVKLEVGFQTMDQYILSQGKGTVTINTAGLFSLQAQGKLVGIVKANMLKLDVAWNPLDILFAGELSYTSFLSGSFSMHGWIGQGWQNKYYWLPPDGKFHFTGTIKGTVKIPKGELINKKYFKLPPFTASISVKVAFGEFCPNATCTSSDYKWGMSATVEVFGYDVGVYVDSGGPDLILGTNSHTLIDQFSGGNKPQVQEIAKPAASFPIITPGMIQAYLPPPISSTLDVVTPLYALNVCSGYSTAIHTCPFVVPTGTGKALFSASWENGALDVVLVKPDNTIINAANAAAHGVTISPTNGELTQGVTFSVRAASGTTLDTGEWKLRLSNVGAGMLPGAANNYSLLFAADPPAPFVQWNALPAPDLSGIVNLSWLAKRGSQAVEPSITAELFYAPVASIPAPHQLPVTFPGNYQAASGLGPDWSPSDLSTEANDANQDGVWKFVTTAIPAGSWEFKVTLGASWEEDYGLGGEPEGQNIPFQVAQSGDPVHFYYDARDHTALSRPDSRIVVLVGDMMSEVGGSNWAPDNLAGWMKDPDGDQVYELSLQLPAGNWQYKIAVNESWAENYGLNNAPDGANIPLTVPAGGGLAVFRFDDSTHEISVELGAPVMTGAILANRISANVNGYAWDTKGLASGAYRVGIRLDDHLKSNGSVVAWAAGKVTIQDITPPPVPNFIGAYGAVNGMVVRWDRDDVTPDLAGYVVEYTIPEWDLVSQAPRMRRVLPSSLQEAPFYEQARLGGLIYTLGTNVCIRAYDASGNVSDCVPQQLEMPEGPAERLGPPRFFNGGGDDRGLHLSWEPPDIGNPDGYLLYYAPAGCLLPDVVTVANEGLSPIILPPGDLNFSISGLTVGQRYRFTLHAFTAQGDISAGVSIVLMYIDPSDFDGDGMADQWEALYGVSNPFDDTDLDGLSDLMEYQNGSNPLHADSDGDEFYDGEEGEWGTDICGPGQPPYHMDPKLVLVSTNTIDFQAAVNVNPGNTEVIQMLNFGGGTLSWNATASERWILLSSTSGSENEALYITVDAAGLIPGTYSGELVISALPAVQRSEAIATIQETVTIPVTLLVSPLKELKLYLPLVKR